MVYIDAVHYEQDSYGYEYIARMKWTNYLSQQATQECTKSEMINFVNQIADAVKQAVGVQQEGDLAAGGDEIGQQHDSKHNSSGQHAEPGFDPGADKDRLEHHEPHKTVDHGRNSGQQVNDGIEECADAFRRGAGAYREACACSP